MSSSIVVSIDCPHCAYSFLEAASLLHPQADARCPSCGEVFALDSELEAMSRLLAQARAAREERKRRRQEIRQLHGPNAFPQPARPPQQLGDVLARLDELLEEMKAHAPAEPARKRA